MKKTIFLNQPTDNRLVPDLSAIGGKISRILRCSHSGIYALLIVMMSMFMFSCEVENISKEEDSKIQIPIKEDYLAFTSYDQFTWFVQTILRL